MPRVELADGVAAAAGHFIAVAARGTAAGLGADGGGLRGTLGIAGPPSVCEYFRSF